MPHSSVADVYPDQPDAYEWIVGEPAFDPARHLQLEAPDRLWTLEHRLRHEHQNEHHHGRRRYRHPCPIERIPHLLGAGMAQSYQRQQRHPEYPTRPTAEPKDQKTYDRPARYPAVPDLAEHCVDDMPPIELPDRQQVERGDQEPYPGRHRDRMEVNRDVACAEVRARMRKNQVYVHQRLADAKKIQDSLHVREAELEKAVAKAADAYKDFCLDVNGDVTLQKRKPAWKGR